MAKGVISLGKENLMIGAIGNFGNGSDRQIQGRIENLRYCTGGSHPDGPDLFSLDLILLILRLSYPNFPYR